jgi:hypothetical protein
MKASEVNLKSLVWSKRAEKFGQVIERKDFMFLILFAGSPPRLWLHANDLEASAPNSLIEEKV